MLVSCRRQIGLLLIVMLLSAGALAQELSPEKAVYRPSVMPDRIVLNLTADPAHSQAITWRTDTSIDKGLAQILVAEPGPLPQSKAIEVNAKTSKLTTRHWSSHYHSVIFESLNPNTLYAYRVGDGSLWSEWFQFRTASDKPVPFSFVYFGDVQAGIRTMWSRVVREAIKTAPEARFFAFGGDLVTDGSDDTLWGELFAAGGWIFGMTSMLPTPGNHEYRNTEGKSSDSVTEHWRPQFTLPPNGPAGLEEYTYYVDIEGLRIISLASTNKVDEQTAWLDKVLADNPNRWTVAFFHHPIFSPATDRDNTRLRAAWKPLFDKYGVDLVLTGHDHSYCRTGLEGSAVYVTSVSGSKMYELGRKPWMKRAAEVTQLFQVIKIDGNKLSYESRTATGSLYDAFDLQKQQGKPNLMTELIPEDIAEIMQKKPAK